ncbi:MAG: glycosyl hydrolase 115 family protein [Chitinophagaceae bacterium]|nr:glycosyl hydrolase 115 family protein [Chitinophagaceae bacterium]
MKKLSFLLLILLCRPHLHAQDITLYTAAPGAFPLVTTTGPTPIYVDSNDHWLVRQAAVFLQQDIQRVTGKTPAILHRMPASAANLIIIGSLDHNPAITPVINDSLRGKWEAFTLTAASHPVKGISQALVITGSDRRGTAYGVFELSRQIGVSPWYWWADVPVPAKKELYIRKDTWVCQHPAVKYRGFFINDEAPCLSGWTKEKFGGFNHLFYEKVFELLLRMKANYLWPAMWGNAFNDDDTLNPILADKYGIVMGTSHHEPMLRAQQEWKRYGSGPWNYETNPAVLDSFWKQGIRNMDSHESIITIGMRGDGDMPMTEGSNIALLEKIVSNQRRTIEDVTGKAPADVPQSWALYKEVQDYYDKGMRVPDDVTLLLCDDNWGNVRKLPGVSDKPRGGGYGIYYHFDYVGDPRNYKWLNTNALPRVWEQMHLTKQYGVDHIWIVNVGDIKPMELPIEFFLDYAWAPDKWPADSLDTYVRQWASRQFGEKYAVPIADILKKYTFYNSRRKPELLSPDTYSLLHYDEAQQVVSDYNTLAYKADSIYNILPSALRDAYFQLVLYPVKACANLNELYYTVGLNHLYAAQGRSATTQMAKKAKTLYLRDSLLSKYYNDTLAGGKWRHMMDQTHIGYTYWQQPPFNSMPAVISAPVCDTPAWGIAIGSSLLYDNSPRLVFSRYGRDHWIDIFSRKNDTLRYTTTGYAPWLRVNPEKEQQLSHQQVRIRLSIDWKQVPPGGAKTRLTISGRDGRNETVTMIALAPSLYDKAPPGTFLEGDGYVSIEAEHYSRSVQTAIKWQLIKGLGRTLSGMEAMPVTSPAQTPGGNSPRLEYDMYLADSGAITVHAYFSPTLNFSGKGLRYAVSIDGGEPQIIDLAENSAGKSWNIAVADNIFISPSSHVLSRPGKHVLKYWMVDPGVVLQKIVVDTGGMQPSYLGPPESRFKAR